MSELELYRNVSGTDIQIARDPELVLAEAQKAAAALQRVIANKNKPVIFNGEQYLEFEDWQTVAKFYGCTAKVVFTRFVEFGDVRGFEAGAVVVDQHGVERSQAEAMCLNDEDNWSTKAKYEWLAGPDGKRSRHKVGEVQVPLFQLRSMAQTRACAKALRNVFSWVVVLAGYKPTPAEEMEGTPAAEANSDVEQPKQSVVPPQQKATPAQPKLSAENGKTIPTGTLRYIRDVKSEDGIAAKTGKPWTRYDIWFEGDSNKYSTFSESIAEIADHAVTNGLAVVADVKSTQSGKYTNWSIEHLEVVPGTERKVEGQGEPSVF